MKWLDMQGIYSMGNHGQSNHAVVTNYDWKNKSWIAVSLVLDGGNIQVADDKRVEEGLYAEMNITDKIYELLHYEHLDDGLGYYHDDRNTMRNISPSNPFLVRLMALGKMQVTDLSLRIGCLENPLKMPGFHIKHFPIILDCGKNMVTLVNLELLTR